MDKFVIVDTGFHPKGHFLTYNQKLAEELERRGQVCEAWIPRAQEPPAGVCPNYLPVLPDASKRSGWKGLLAYGIGLFLSMAIRARKNQVHFWPIASSTSNLVATLLACAGRPQVLVLNFSPQRSSRALRMLERLSILTIRAAVALGAPLKVFACSHMIVDEFRKLGCPVSGKLLTIGHQPEPQAAPSGGHTHFCVLGPPRDGDPKGLAWLVETLYLLRPELEAGQMSWVLQVGPRAGLTSEPGPSIQKLLEQPLPGLRLLDRQLTDEEYQQELTQSHYLVACYDPDFYRGIPSGIVAEALAAGRPFLGTENTWSAEVAHQTGCGLICPYGDRAALRAALLEACRQRDVLCQKAWDQRTSWSQEHSIQSYVDKLVPSESDSTASLKPRKVRK